jgi:RNA polymerase sigma-70 factor (ECF subfamily)
MHVPDHELLLRLLDQHSPALVLYAQQWCETPEDVVQEAFIRLMRERPVPQNAVGWLYKVVRNEAINQSRSRGRRTRHETAAAEARPAWFVPADDEALDAPLVVAAMESLPMHVREVIVLRLWSGLSFEEISELIDKSTSTAHRWYESGIAELKLKWSESCLNPKTQR